MNPNERLNDLELSIRTAILGMLRGVWTAMPGIIQSFDPAKQTATVQIAIQGIIQSIDGSYQAESIQVLTDVPVVFPRGGGATLTFPIAEGDECLLVFSARCIDSWWQSGEVQQPVEARTHDLSDGFAIIGPFSQLTKLADYSTTTVQLRNNDGTAFFELNPETGAAKILAPGGLTIIADVTLTGTMAASGDVTAIGKSVAHHTHSQPPDSHGDTEENTSQPL